MNSVNNPEQVNKSEFQNLKINNIFRPQLTDKNLITVKNIQMSINAKVQQEEKGNNPSVCLKKPKKFEYTKLTPCFLCKRGKSYKIVNKLKFEFQKEMDISRLFSLLQKFKLTEKLLFDEKTRKIKSFLDNYELLIKLDELSEDNRNIIITNKDLSSLKENKNIIDINALLYEKLRKLSLV